MSQTSKHALALVADPGFVVKGNELSRLQRAAVEQLKLVAQLQTEAAVRAVLVGTALLRIKASMKHGTFMPWCAENITVGKSQVNNYMRLAQVFLERSKVAKPDLLALPGDQLSLETESATAKRFMEKLAGFCGEHSLTELLIKHGIKAVGLKTELQQQAAGEQDLTPEQRAAELRELAWKQAWDATQQLRATLTEPEKLSLIDDPKHVEQLKAEVVELNALLDERLAALRSVNV